MTDEPPVEEQFTKEQVDDMISEKLSEQEKLLNTKMDERITEVKEELKPKEVKPTEAPKYVDESFGTDTNFSYNDLMAKVVDVVKEHVPQADTEAIAKEVKDSLKQDEEAKQTEAKQADEAWDNQVTDLKKAENLDDKTITEIITKATKWNKENPDGVITSMKLAHEFWKKGKEVKPRIPGAPTNNADDDPEQKIFASSEDAMAYWLNTYGK